MRSEILPYHQGLAVSIARPYDQQRRHLCGIRHPPPLILELYLVITFIDGLLFGLAIKKGIVAFIVFLIAAFLATYIGLSLPGISISTLFSKEISFITFAVSRAPAIMVGLPILFFAGLGIGLWKG